MPPSALALHDGEVGWEEESAVFELPAARPAPARAALAHCVRGQALNATREPSTGAAATRGAALLDALRVEGTAVEGTAVEGTAVEGMAVEGTVVEGMAVEGMAGDAPPLDDVGRLFSNYRAYVAKIGRRILGASSEVDDLIQDVFLATVRDAHKIKDPARLAGWLGTVTTRMAKRRRFRSSHYPMASEDLEDLVDHVQDDGPGPESSADLSGNIRKLLSLPDELRTPWLLKHVEGHTLEDVARQCDCSLSTAARRIQNASSKLGRGR